MLLHLVGTLTASVPLTVPATLEYWTIALVQQLVKGNYGWLGLLLVYNTMGMDMVSLQTRHQLLAMKE